MHYAQMSIPHPICRTTIITLRQITLFALFRTEIQVKNMNYFYISEVSMSVAGQDVLVHRLSIASVHRIWGGMRWCMHAEALCCFKMFAL